MIVNAWCTGHHPLLLVPFQTSLIENWFILPALCYRASLVAQTIKNLPAVQETRVASLGGKDPLKKGMAALSSILAWRIPWTREPGGLTSMGSHRIGHDWGTNTFIFTPLYCCPWRCWIVLRTEDPSPPLNERSCEQRDFRDSRLGRHWQPLLVGSFQPVWPLPAVGTKMSLLASCVFPLSPVSIFGKLKGELKCSLWNKPQTGRKTITN